MVYDLISLLAKEQEWRYAATRFNEVDFLSCLREVVDDVLEGFEDDEDALYAADLADEQDKDEAMFTACGYPVSSQGIRDAVKVRELLEGYNG